MLGKRWALLTIVLYFMDLYHIWLTIIKSFIDFSKAFDYVVRSNLWHKLIRLGFRGNLLNVLRSMYECIKSRVKVSNSLSN